MAVAGQEIPPAANCVFESGSSHMSLPATHPAPGLDGGLELPKLVREAQNYVSVNGADVGRLHCASHGNLTPPRSASVCLMRTSTVPLMRADIASGEGCVTVKESNGSVHCISKLKHHDQRTTNSPPHNSVCVKPQCSNCTSMTIESGGGCDRKRTKSLSSDDIHKQAPTCRRRILTDVERNLTFRPKLNKYSLKIAARNTRNSVPVVHRLLEARRTQQEYQDPRLTFAPKLNALSVKLAQERNAKMPEVQARMTQLAELKKAEVLSEYTFKPQVSQRSQQIAMSLGTTFQARQQTHLERKRKKEMDNAYKASPPRFSKSRRIIKLSPRVPQALSNNQNIHDQYSCDDSAHSSDTDNTNSPPTTATSIEQSSNKLTTSSPSRNHLLEHRLHTKHKTTTTTSSSPGLLLKRRRARSAGTSSSDRVKLKTAAVAAKKEGEREAGDTPDPDELLLNRDFSTLSDSEKCRRVKIKAEKLRKAKRIFLISGTYKRIRKCLRQRGWVELEYQRFIQNHSTNYRGDILSTPDKKKKVTERKFEVHNGPNGGGDSDHDDNDVDDDGDGNVSEDEYSDEEEYQLLSRAIRNYIPHFVWTLKREDVIYHSVNKDTLLNHYVGSSSFTTKVGICNNLRNVLWYGDTDPHTFFPRCYLLSSIEDKQAFIDDYQLTAALCILKRLPAQYTAEEPPPPQVEDSTPSEESSSGTKNESPPVIPEEAVELAMKAAKASLSSLEHEDIEGSQHQLCPKLMSSEWETLVKYFYSMVFENAKVHCSTYTISKVNGILQEVESHFPQLHMDGCRNVWIVKPGAKSRGRGIMCMDRLESILELVSTCSSVVRNEGKWVIQKYIERPMLISDTKFDIRQWFLVTDWNPLTMWMYKESYLRFSSQKFTLEDLDQSIHLCNNSVQKYYENASSRDSILPAENMWDSEQFKQYLNSIGQSTLWDSVIYPEMKQALIHCLQVSQDATEHRKNSFELYGADFMISSDYRPWLIEINCSPSMEASTEVTARLCKQVLEDTLKVVLDRREDKECDIGMFELAYKQPKLDLPSYIGIQLCVQGTSIPRPRNFNRLPKKPSVLQIRAPINATSHETLQSNSNKSTVSDSRAVRSECTTKVVTPTKCTESRASSRASGTGRVTIIDINCKLPEMRVC